ncbi:MAG TPA: hypothetical protein VLX28_16575 [Thermoanaerobaculia bacterium]|nr:hypothetical protein [Thermoanaerobaculia bacterium]
MKKVLVPVFLCMALLVFGSAASYAGGTACFDWSCDVSTYSCNFDASCSSASPYILFYVIDFGDGSSAGPSSSPYFSHTYTSGYSASVTVTISFFSDPSYDSATCYDNYRVFPVGPQAPTSGRCQ